MRKDQLYDVLLSPVFSEKANQVSDFGKYVFKVLPSANKKQVTLSVEKSFDVKVSKVNIINIHAKKKVFKQVRGVRSGFKKAVVTLKSGYKLDLIASQCEVCNSVWH